MSRPLPRHTHEPDFQAKGFDNLDPSIRNIALSHLTDKQIAAYELWEDGLGYGRIADLLHISPSSARDRIHRSLRTIENALEANQ